ncbi:CopG family ribbon-helix-helix protein [Paracidovorax anthurii]|nr:ribbon-helix-helix domain-containing protein [Paracidovorax anthurii]
MTAPAVRPVAIKIDEETKARVKRLAEACHRTSHWLMREAITQDVDRARHSAGRARGMGGVPGHRNACDRR